MNTTVLTNFSNTNQREYHFYWKKAKLACNLTKQYLVGLAGAKQKQSLSSSPMQPALIRLKSLLFGQITFTAKE